MFGPKVKTIDSLLQELQAAPHVDRYRRLLAPDDPRHGTLTGYINHACRCEKCRKASNAYQRERYKDPKIRAQKNEARKRYKQRKKAAKAL